MIIKYNICIHICIIIIYVEKAALRSLHRIGLGSAAVALCEDGELVGMLILCGRYLFGIALARCLERCLRRVTLTGQGILCNSVSYCIPTSCNLFGK